MRYKIFLRYFHAIAFYAIAFDTIALQGVLGLRQSLLTMFQGYERTLNAVLALI